MALGGSTTCLVVIFNHYYAGNIEKLLKIYDGRFSRIVFLVPNVRLDRAGCCTVYRGPFCFQGYIADALDFLAESGSDHYIFAGDDVLLHPRWREHDYVAALGLDQADGFFPELRPFAGTMLTRWDWSQRIMTRLFTPKHQLLGSGVENAMDQFPDPAAAKAKFAAVGFHETMLEWTDPSGKILRAATPIPMAWGVSDFFAIRGERLERFAHYCGILAALDIFVEAAIPTALVLACDSVQQCRPPWRFDWQFTPLGRAAAAPRWSDVTARFDDHMLFVHPVKLSGVPIGEL
jgi:hypothetical protein